MEHTVNSFIDCNDYSQYFNLLANKPLILELPCLIDENLLSGITGFELSQLYLVNLISYNNKQILEKKSRDIALKILDPITDYALNNIIFRGCISSCEEVIDNIVTLNYSELS